MAMMMVMLMMIPEKTKEEGQGQLFHFIVFTALLGNNNFGWTARLT